MKALNYILILLSATLLGSCKHEVIPAPVSNSPIFGIEGTFDDSPLSYVAGVDGMNMKPTVLTANGINIYNGVLGDGESYFQLEIFNGDIDFPTQPKINFNSIQEIAFVPYDQETLWSIKKMDLPGSGVDEITWFVNGAQQVILDDLKLNKPGKYEICAKIRFEDQTESTLCRQVIVGFRKNADFNLNFDIVSGSKLIASVSNTLGAITGVNWFLNETLIATGLEIDTLLDNDKYLLRAEVTFGNGIVLDRSALVDVSWQANHVPDFTAYANATTNTWDNKARITLFKDGKKYSSENYHNAEKLITVDQIEYHGTDASGAAVYILKGDVDIMLQDSTQQAYPLKAKLGVGFSVR